MVVALVGCDPGDAVRRRVVVVRAGDGEGRVVSDPPGIDCTSECSAWFDAPAVVLRAVPDASSWLESWRGRCEPQAADLCVVPLDASQRVTVRFSATRLTVDSTGGGRLLSTPPGIDCGAACSAVFATGTDAALSAVADAGAAFAGWSGDCSGGATGCALALARSRRVDAFFSPPTAVWSAALGGDSVDFVNGIDVGPGGDVFVAGSVGLFVSSAYLAMIEGENGTQRWSRVFDAGGDSVRAWRVAAGRGDGVYLCGFSWAAVDLGAGLVPAGGWLVEYASADASPRWMRAYGGYSRCLDVAVDPAGDVVVVGIHGDPVDLGARPVAGVAPVSFFVVKYGGADGRHLWSRTFAAGGGGSPRWVGSVAIDGSGDVVIAAQFEGSSDFGGGTLVSAGALDGVVGKYRGADGAHLWSRRFGGAGADAGDDLSVDERGDVLVVGSFEDTMDLGGAPLLASGRQDGFLAKLAGLAGEHLWSRPLGGTGYDAMRAVAAGPGGDVYVAGDFEEIVDFGGGPRAAAGWSDVVLARFTGAGGHVWSRRYGGVGFDRGVAMVVRAGVLTAAGDFNRRIDFGRGPLLAHGAAADMNDFAGDLLIDVFVVRLVD